jgi:flagellar biosynthesis/type III secretory pathway protein FliH
VAQSDSSRALAADARKVLKQAHDRGVEEGEALGYEKGLAAASRQALLEMHADGLEASSKLVEDEAAETALKEAAALLRDLVAQGADGVGRRVRRRSVTAGG